MLVMLALAMQASAPLPPPPAETVAPGIVDTEADEYGPTFADAGQLIVFTRREDRRGRESLWAARRHGDGWARPERLPFSDGLDKEPAFSPDGRWLFFASTRDYQGKAPPPSGLQGGALAQSRHDIWMVERTADGWGTPRPVPGEVNTGVYENYPSVASSGALYWAGYRAGGRGRNDLWSAPRRGEAWGPAGNLTALNSEGTDADPYVAPDESYILFSSDRPGGAGEGDLYLSVRRAGRWSEPVNLGPVVNSADYEYTPWVSHDLAWLYFSRGWGEILRVPAREVPALAAVLGPGRP
jgi:hypothetical protein